jgi:hypothetical protein
MRVQSQARMRACRCTHARMSRGCGAVSKRTYSPGQKEDVIRRAMVTSCIIPRSLPSPGLPPASPAESNTAVTIPFPPSLTSPCAPLPLQEGCKEKARAGPAAQELPGRLRGTALSQPTPELHPHHMPGEVGRSHPRDLEVPRRRFSGNCCPGMQAT